MDGEFYLVARSNAPIGQEYHGKNFARINKQALLDGWIHIRRLAGVGDLLAGEATPYQYNGHHLYTTWEAAKDTGWLCSVTLSASIDMGMAYVATWYAGLTIW